MTSQFVFDCCYFELSLFWEKSDKRATFFELKRLFADGGATFREWAKITLSPPHSIIPPIFTPISFYYGFPQNVVLLLTDSTQI